MPHGLVRAICGVGFRVAVGVLALELVAAVLRTLWTRGSGERSMEYRRRELAEQTGRPVWSAVSLVSSARTEGHGKKAIAVLRSRWAAQHPIVLLYRATKSLVDYYESVGGRPDGDHPRRMTLD